MAKKCVDCGGKLELVKGAYKGIAYSAYRCTSCGEEIMDMEQADSFMKSAEKARQVTFSKWGQSLAVRIPAQVARRLGIKNKQTGKLFYEKNGFRIVPTPA